MLSNKICLKNQNRNHIIYFGQETKYMPKSFNNSNNKDYDYEKIIMVDNRITKLIRHIHIYSKTQIKFWEQISLPKSCKFT